MTHEDRNSRMAQLLDTLRHQAIPPCLSPSQQHEQAVARQYCKGQAELFGNDQQIAEYEEFWAGKGDPQ